ncbi:MAG: 50S ribosomal protein L3 [Alphaproteobacteria bacterium]|nr:50S ribosomal protein L3 [Alphaproteobacteria bacterium]
MRTGLVAEKMGMTQIFLESGVQLPVTVLKIKDTVVLDQRTEEKHGYTALQLGLDPVKASKVNNPQRAAFAKMGVEPCKIVKEFRVDADNMLPVGTTLKADHFVADQFVDITGTSQGKGFAGVMKRHNFGGLRASHGVSISHRSHGSTGQCQDPGKVFKNKKMAGQMGSKRVTKLNLKVHAVDAERGLIYIHGCVPGHKNGIVYIRDAIKKTARA